MTSNFLGSGYSSLGSTTQSGNQGFFPGVWRGIWKIPLEINVLSLTGSLAILATGGYAYSLSDFATRTLTGHEYAEVIDFGMRSLGTAGGITVATYVGQGLLLNGREKERKRLVEQQEREENLKRLQKQELALRVNDWHGLALNSMRIAVVPEIDKIVQQFGATNITKQRDEIKGLTETNSVFRENAKSILNFLEGFAIDIESGDIDEDAAYQKFGLIVVQTVSYFFGWINHEIEKPNRKNAYCTLLDLYTKWSKRLKN